MRLKNLQFERFGRLVVLGRDPNKNGFVVWRCACECGGTKSVLGSNLRNGNTTSCGCKLIERNSSHGMTNTPTYTSWYAMKSRVKGHGEKHKADYLDRGITMCDRWQSFENFYADMGERPEGMTLDRIDNDGNYEPQNCKWSTALEQASNKRAPVQHGRYRRAGNE